MVRCQPPDWRRNGGAHYKERHYSDANHENAASNPDVSAQYACHCIMHRDSRLLERIADTLLLKCKLTRFRFTSRSLGDRLEASQDGCTT